MPFRRLLFAHVRWHAERVKLYYLPEDTGLRKILAITYFTIHRTDTVGAYLDYESDLITHDLADAAELLVTKWQHCAFSCPRMRGCHSESDAYPLAGVDRGN